jgi:hypothetical protein
MRTFIPCILTFLLMQFFISCKKSTSESAEPKINFIFKFDSTQTRLNNLGQLSAMPAGHAGQSPVFNLMSAHYLELAPTATTLLGAGQVLYRAPETNAGGETAIDFNQSSFAGNGEVFVSVPLKSLAPGSYDWLRVSLAYQNYDIKVKAAGQLLTGTVASFIGFRTFLQSYKVKDSTITVNANRKQGYWAFETSAFGLGFVTSGQAPEGATTVPNPLAATSPVPPGSCVVTGKFSAPLVITGSESKDVNVIVSLSTNKSFEWKDTDLNGTYDPQVDTVVDMGIRGLIPIQQP